ncbi:carbohydrate-binding protein [Corynebacterium ulceribovis]|uniref:carbohydrate-binding protein n=1 Tax=Corynebacterium ulceribovis TaxID=487732 RepID=UPI00035DFF73|nr:carbohydrate-binding protein [Corynebacterium ulceribovis]
MNINLQTLTKTQFDAHLRAVLAEQDRRRALPHVEQAQANVVKELQDAGKLPLPDALSDPDHLPENLDDIPAWANPGTDHSAMYRHGDIVSHDGRVWQSTHPHLNHWEPGATGIDNRVWRDITPKPEPDPTEETQTPDDQAQEHPTADEEPPADEEPTAEASTPQPPEYTDNRSYKAGDTVTYNGNTYQAQQDHFSAPGWTPLNAHMMWKRTEPAAG